MNITALDSKFSAILKIKRYNIYLIILFGVVIRCYNFTKPLLDIVSWRETQTAMITRNLVNSGFDLFHPRIDWFGNNVAYLALEFPLYNLIVGFSYLLFGKNEIYGRIVSILFSAGAMIFFYKLAKLLFGEKIAFYSLLFYVFCPLSIFYNQTYMPESLMLFLSIGAVYFLFVWNKDSKKIHLLLALLFSALAFLVKSPVTIQLLFPLLYLFWNKYRKRIIWKPQFYLFFFLAYSPIILWSFYSQSLTHQYFPGENLYKAVGNMTPRFELLSYLRIAGFIFVYLLLPHGVLMFLYGLFKKKVSPNEKFVIVWLLSVIVYAFIFFPALEGHHHYLIPFIMPVSLIIGKGIYLSIERLRQSNISKLNLSLVNVFFIITFACSILLPLVHMSKQDTAFLDAANEVKKLTTPNDLILSATFHAKKNAVANPALLYYADRHGWLDLFPYDTEKLIKTINSYKIEGAKYLVLTFSNNFEERSILGTFSSHKPDFDINKIQKLLRKYFEILELGNSFTIYRL